MTESVLQILLQRFAEAECSWLSTMRPNGRLHSAPVWHIWLDGRAYVVTMATAVKTSNIRHNPSVVISHPDPKDTFIIEGTAHFAPEMWPQLKPLLQAKYGWNIDAPEEAAYNTVIAITPAKLIAWGQYGNGRWSGSEVQLNSE